jgi:hypothetical protein
VRQGVFSKIGQDTEQNAVTGNTNIEVVILLSDQFSKNPKSFCWVPTRKSVPLQKKQVSPQ